MSLACQAKSILVFSGYTDDSYPLYRIFFPFEKKICVTQKLPVYLRNLKVTHYAKRNSTIMAF